MLQQRQIPKLSQSAEEDRFLRHGRILILPHAKIEMVPRRLIDADIDTLQICESSCDGAEGAVPGAFFGFGGNVHVQVEVAEGEGLGAGGEGGDVGCEFGEEGGVLEGECVGGVEDGVRFVGDLAACVEEIDG